MINRIIAICSLLVLFTACDLDGERVTVPDPKDVRDEILLGEKVSQELIGQLGETLMKTIDVSGFVNTISICNHWAPLYSERIAEQYEEIRSIKRTSLNVRNQNNKPDKYEKEALLFFLDEISKDAPDPDFYVQRVYNTSDSFIKYYKPLYVKDLCLSCHGPEKLINPEILQKIKSFYPRDEATGYMIDDFRGLVSVTINQVEEVDNQKNKFSID